MTAKDFFTKSSPLIYKKGDVIIRPNEPINKIFYLSKGSVKQYLVTSTGAKVVVHVFTKGTYFPIALVLGKKKNRSYFCAISNIKVYEMESDKVIKWLKKEPYELFKLTCRFAGGLNGMTLRLEGALEQELQERLLSLVKYFSKRFTKDGKKTHHIGIPLSHKELACWLGVSRETVSRAMKKLEREGRVSYKYRKITFHDNKSKKTKT